MDWEHSAPVLLKDRVNTPRYGKVQVPNVLEGGRKEVSENGRKENYLGEVKLLPGT